MKKIILFAVILVSPFYSAAQNGNSDESRFLMGTKGGFGHSWISSYNNAFNGSWFIGLSTLYHFTDHLALGVDALYSSEGATYKVIDISSSTQLDYFRLPVKLSYYFAPRENDLRPKVALGPSFGFLMSDPQNKSAGYESMDAGLSASAGIDYRVLSGFWLTFDANYYNGLTDIYKGNTASDMNRNLRLDIGLMVNF
jgi:outer membrane protein W